MTKKKKKKRWLGLEPHEALTDPVRDGDDSRAVYRSGIKIEDAKRPKFVPVVYQRKLHTVKGKGKKEKVYWGEREEAES